MKIEYVFLNFFQSSLVVKYVESKHGAGQAVWKMGKKHQE